MMPKISVIMTSYNYEKFIYEAVKSVLAQSYEDFELIIVDDASSDNSVKYLKRIEDKRVRLILHEKNQGVCFSVNEAFENCRGEYIALISSDDRWKEKKLELQLGFLEEHPDFLAVFSTTQTIDEQGRPLKNSVCSSFPAGIDRLQILRSALRGANILNAPSEILRRSALDGEKFFYDPRFAQSQDFEQHIRLALKGDMHVMPIPLVEYRWHGKNASKPSDIATMRSYLEISVLLDSLLRLKDMNLLLALFPDLEEEMRDKRLIPFVLGREALRRQSIFVYLWGYRVIADFMADPDKAAFLKDRTGFTIKDFYALPEIFSPLGN